VGAGHRRRTDHWVTTVTCAGLVPDRRAYDDSRFRPERRGEHTVVALQAERTPLVDWLMPVDEARALIHPAISAEGMSILGFVRVPKGSLDHPTTTDRTMHPHTLKAAAAAAGRTL
jgi:hypothetical protein